MASQAQIKAQAKYDKHNTQQVVLKLNINSDADVLAMLQKQKNKQGYIKHLVRRDMRQTENGVLSLENIKNLLLPVIKKYEIGSLKVFGSYARNEATPSSDVDLIIDGGNFQGLIEYMTMIDAMRSALGKEVDLVTQSSLNRSRTQADLTFKNNIEKESIVLI